MAKLLVLYYSSWGHVETMAEAIAAGAAEVAGTDVTVKRVPETVPDEVAEQQHYKRDQAAAIAEPGELADYDAIIFGAPTRFGNMAGEMRSFMDRTGGLWAKGALIGKIGAAFTSTGNLGGGQESTILTFIPTLLHHGMIFAGLPYSAPELTDNAEPHGGSPYGAGTIAQPDGSGTPTEKELNLARFQGRHVAELAPKHAS